MLDNILIDPTLTTTTITVNIASVLHEFSFN